MRKEARHIVGAQQAPARRQQGVGRGQGGEGLDSLLRALMDVPTSLSSRSLCSHGTPQNLAMGSDGLLSNLEGHGGRPRLRVRPSTSYEALENRFWGPRTESGPRRCSCEPETRDLPREGASGSLGHGLGP